MTERTSLQNFASRSPHCKRKSRLFGKSSRRQTSSASCKMLWRARGGNSKRASNSQLARRRGPHSCVVAPGFLKFCAILFLKILIYARVVHRPPLLEEPEMAVRTETSPPGGSASEFASRVAPRRRGATVLTHAVTTAGDGPTSRRTNFAISREGSRPSGAAASPRLSRSGLFSNLGARKFSCLQGIENSRNAEIFALVSPREARKWTTPTRTSSAPPHLIWSRHLSPRARKFSWLQSIENSRNEKIVALEVAK